MKAACLLVAALITLAACQTPPPVRSPSGMSTDIFEDIPAPRSANYIYRGNESFSYRARTFRCGRFLYSYEGSTDDAIRFFKETMSNPPYSWTLVDEDVTGEGSTTLLFNKNDDRCTVGIDRVERPRPGTEETAEILVRVNYRK